MLLSDVPFVDRDQILGGCIAYHPKHGWIKLMSFDHPYVSFIIISTGKSVVDEGQDDLILLKTPSLGYLNIKEHAVYAYRIPRRIMKGGVCSNNTDACTAYNKSVIVSKDQLVRLARSFPPESIHMFNGVYPTYAECVNKIKKGEAYNIAFDRQFSICVNGSTYYCGKHKVGTWDEKGIKFLPEHAYLEMMIGDNCGKALQSSKSAPKTRVVGS